MASCIINNETVKRKIYETAVQIDNDVVIVNDSMMFSSPEAFQEFISSIKDVFGINDLSQVFEFTKSSNTIHITDTSLIEDMARFETPQEPKSDYILSNMTNIKEYGVDDAEAFVSDYMKYMRSVQNEIDNITLVIKNLRDNFRDSSISVSERRKTQKLIKQYSIVREHLYEQKKKSDINLNAATDKMKSAVDMLKYIVENADRMTDPNLVETCRNIIEDVEQFMEGLGDKKYTPEIGRKASDELDMNIKNTRAKIKELKLQFGRMLAQQQQRYLATNPILLSDEKMRLILQDPSSDEYKKMFGGAAIGDINFLESLGLNVDTKSKFDGVLGELLMTEFERKAQDNNNECFGLKKRLLDMARSFKSHGINLESGKDTDFLYEKDSSGNRTGYFINPISYSFRKKSSDFYSASFNLFTEENKKKVFDFIVNDGEILDIFKLDLLHKPLEEIKQDAALYEFYKCCRNIFEKKYGNADEFDKFLVKKGFDAEYQNKIKSLLGEKLYNEYVDNYTSAIMDYWYSHEDDIATTDHLNPFEIANKIEEIKKNSKAKVITGKKGSRKAYRFNMFMMLPSKDEGYNQEFKRNFIDDRSELGDLKRELYGFVYDTYLKFNLLYEGKNTLKSSNIETNVVDDMADAVKGVLKLNDVGDNLRKIKDNAARWLSDQFFGNDYFTKDENKVALNYSDRTQKIYDNVLEKIRTTPNKSEIDRLAVENGINKSNYATEDEYHSAIARKISLHGFSDNFYVTTMKSLDLFYAQKTRNEIFPVAKMIQRMYESYTNGSGMERKNANKRMRDFITRSIQKINLEDGELLVDKKLSNITIVKNMLSRFDEMPIVSKFLNKSLMKKMSADEKALVEALREAKEHINGNDAVKFTYNDVIYERRKVNGIVSYHKNINGNDMLIDTDEGIADFKNKMSEYYDKRISELGADSTIQNVINVIRGLLLYKMLAGISTSGLFNRIEGHLANSEMDATGYYWTPGNLNYVEKYFLGAGLQRYINKRCEKVFVDENKNWVKRMDILRKISEQTNLFQDMKNQFDRTIEGEQKGVLRHNLDLFQLSVSNPEFKNQMSAVLARMLDVEIADKDGNMHKMFDTKTGEFTCFDIVNGELVLKPEFDIEENKSWVDFRSTVDVRTVKENGDEINEKRLSPSFEFMTQCKEMIKNIHGDYRTNSALGYNNNVLLSHLMMLKRWLPQKVLRGWSEGGSIDPKTGEFIENYSIIMHNNEQSGVWYDTLFKGKSGLTVMLPVILSTTKLHKGLLQTVAGSAASFYMIGKVIKNKLGARDSDIQQNVSSLEETAEMMKAMLYEMMIFVPRNLPRVFDMRFDVSKHSFTDEKFEQEYGAITLGNFRACARQMATYFYIALIGVLAKLIFWDPDDGDEDERRKMYNWVDNNLENILSTMTSTLFMIDNIEDKADVSNIPIIRWCNDMGKFCNAVNDMDSDKAWRYANKVFIPVRFPSHRDYFNPFSNMFEYEKDTWDDRLIKNIKTEGEWGAEQDYKHIRAEIKRQYVDMWKDEELPDYAINALSSQMQKKGYDNVYDIPEDVFKDMVSKSTLIPSKKQKEYKERDYKFMHDVLMDEYENNPYLKNHALRFIFGGYDNRIGSYFQRMYDSDYERVRDNPYIDDGD